MRPLALVSVCAFLSSLGCGSSSDEVTDDAARIDDRPHVSVSSIEVRRERKTVVKRPGLIIADGEDI